jgi:peptidoglycan/LPS O-acetylase OafA/YrhL
VYLPQLDALRVLAVAMVICNHWRPHWQAFWFNGGLGVQLFFILSGFLITGILLDARASAEHLGIGVHRVLPRFYARRFLRLVPAFYLAILIGLFVGDTRLRDSLVWHLAYLSNVFFARQGTWVGSFSHFWSLAVEEQFYVVWPCVLLFTPRRWLVPLMGASVVAGPLVRAVAPQAGFSEFAVKVMPVSVVDQFGIGALFALLWREVPRRVRTVAVASGAIGGGGFVLAHVAGLGLGDAFRNGLLAYLVFAASQGIGGRLRGVLESRPVLYVGKISYGIYLFHNFVPALARRFVQDALGTTPLALVGAQGTLVLNLCVLLAVSALSWHLLEKPVNRLKRFVPYVPDGRRVAASMAAAGGLESRVELSGAAGA